MRLQAVEAENRFATPDEQEILSQYVGSGSLADAFDESKPTWGKEYAELKALLSPEEYSSARATTLNAHYTSPTVIKANSTSCVPFPDADLSEQLADAITNIHAEISDYERGEDEPEEDNSIPADPRVRNYSYTVVDGKIYYRQDSRMIPPEFARHDTKPR